MFEFECYISWYTMHYYDTIASNYTLACYSNTLHCLLLFLFFGGARRFDVYLIQIRAYHRTQPTGVASGVVPSLRGSQYGPMAGGGLSVGHPQGFQHPDGSIGPYPAPGTRPLTQQSPYSQYKSVLFLVTLVVCTCCNPKLSFNFRTLSHALRHISLCLSVSVCLSVSLTVSLLFCVDPKRHYWQFWRIRPLWVPATASWRAFSNPVAARNGKSASWIWVRITCKNI